MSRVEARINFFVKVKKALKLAVSEVIGFARMSFDKFDLGISEDEFISKLESELRK